MNIHNWDLNLLKIFEALSTHRNVSRASVALGLTQPAVSNALTRLREMMGDPLFVRASKGMTLTPLASRIELQVQEILQMTRRLAAAVSQEDILQSFAGRVRISTTDYVEYIAYEKLLEKAEKEIPRLTIVTRPTTGHLPKAEMESGEIDLAIAGFFGELPEGFFRQKLCDDESVVLVKKNSRHIKGKLTSEKIASSRNMMISPHGDLRGKVDEQLKKVGKHRFVSFGTPFFISAALLAVQRDEIIVGPRRILGKMADEFGFKVLSPQLDLPKITIYQVWHSRVHQDPVQRWVRETLFDIFN